MSTVTTIQPVPVPTRTPRPAPPTATQVLLLQAVRDYPAVSLLMNTNPAAVMTAADAATLRHLIRQATRRLGSETLPETDEVLRAIDRLASQATSEPTSEALAVYASRRTALVVHLPVKVQERVVIDPTFSTRDLVRALHRTPRHIVLVLTSREARVLDGVGDSLVPAPGGRFPLRNPRPRSHDPARPALADADHETFLRNVDRALAVHLKLHPAPVVIVGPDRLLARFMALTRLPRIAGAIPANIGNFPLTALAKRIKPVMETYLCGRQDEALRLLDRNTGGRRAVSGMQSCWLAARHEPVEMLAVEQGLFYPARLRDQGDLLMPAHDVEHPEVLDDAVDELIELVLRRGGWVALVEDGALTAHDRVALTVRSRR